MVQWLRVCLPMQGTQVRALVWEDPTCRGATGPVGHKYWACASGACAPQQERPRWWEACASQWGVAPACRSKREPSHRNEDPTQLKIKFKKKIRKYYEHLHANKFDNVGEMDKLIEKLRISKLLQKKKRDNLNSPIYIL